MSEKILDIWKQVVYLAAKYSNYSDKEKDRLIDKFWEYREVLWEWNCKYSRTVLWFIQDLESDIYAWRKLEIDDIQHDNYLENYFISKRELSHYNKLIDKNIYRKIFDEFNSSRNLDIIEKLTKQLVKNFVSEYKNLSPENIAKNLLIFSNFDKKVIWDWLKNLYKVFTLLPNNKELFIELRKINSLYYQLIQEVYTFWVDKYHKKDFNVFYATFTKQNNSSKLEKIDASKQSYRTGNPDYEYRQLLLKLRY